MTIKTAISIPEEDFRIIEKIRKKTHKNRSKILMEAFHEWVQKSENAILEDRYVSGYQKLPENKEEIRAFLQAGSAVWGKEEWK